jgi:protein-S-isoprenylcysteine O-methyltransferase Ste14
MGISADSAQEKRKAVLGTIAMGLAPAVFAGAVPWRITRWRVRWPVPGGAPAQILGAALIGAGAAAVSNSFVRFAAEGVGTPAPIAPTKYLVVGGLYRYVRNPMYLALEAVIFGQGLLLGQPKLFLYGAVAAVPPAAFVHFYEEPTLARTFGAEYERFRRNVPGWLPRLRPWRPEAPVLEVRPRKGRRKGRHRRAAAGGTAASGNPRRTDPEGG